ncbi:MAG: rhodanese-like domain-containing protein, partial [Fluviibacter sp.]
MTITKGYKQLIAEAREKIRTLSTEEAMAKFGDPNVVFVDIRDVRELEREGMIPNAFHAPRGMLEFWVDPASPYHKPVFADEGREFVLFCGAGWRS